MSDKLAVLPQPQLVEEFTVDQILQGKLATFLKIYKEDTGTDYTDLTESSIVVRLLRSASEEEAALRVQINERHRSKYVYFSRDENLQILAREEGIIPAQGETDARLRERIIEERSGSSSAGPPEWYRQHALAVAPDEIEDVTAERMSLSHIRIAISARNEDGIPSADLVARVHARLTSDEVHADDEVLIEVIGAEPQVLHVRALIYLFEDVDTAVFDALFAVFKKSFALRRGLGRKIPWGWCQKTLIVDGVFDAADNGSVIPDIARHQIARLGELDLQLATERQR